MNHLGVLFLVVCLAGVLLTRAEAACPLRAVRESEQGPDLLIQLRNALPARYKNVLADEVRHGDVLSLSDENLRILINTIHLAYNEERIYQKFKVIIALFDCR